MSKRIKNLMTEELKGRYEGVDSALLVDPTGLDAITNNQMRGELHSKSIHVEVVKNSLAKRAFLGGPLEALAPLLAGPIAMVTGGESIVDTAKLMAAWSKKTSKLAVRGAVVEGVGLDAGAAAGLAKMLGRTELQQKVVGMALAPGGNLVGAIMSPARVIAGCVQAIADKDEAA